MDDVELPGEPTFHEIPPEALAVSNPFGDQDSVMMRLHKKVNLNQLVDELAAETLVTPQVALIDPYPDSILREDAARLYVTPPLPEHVLEKVVAAHEPDELYGLDESQRERLELVGRLREGEELTPAELRRALLMALSKG